MSVALFLAIIILLGVNPSCDAQGALKKFGKTVVGVIIGAGESSMEYTKEVDNRDWDDLARNINYDMQEEQKQPIISDNEPYSSLVHIEKSQKVNKQENTKQNGSIRRGNINQNSYSNDIYSINRVEESSNWLTEEMPEYDGGMEAMYLFLRSELNYPRIAVKKNIQGTVLLEFVVECDGSITNVKPIVSLCPRCDKEAIRVVKKMPKWKPGILRGKPIRCYFNLPIRFTLK